jgi:hypothetical protein
MGALFVDPPASSPAKHDQPKIVPATGPWIKLGVDRSDAPRTAAVTPEDDLTAQSEEKKQGRPSRKSRAGIQLASDAL